MIPAIRLSLPLYPLACQLCGGAAGRERELCVPCEAALPWIRQGCKSCGLPLPTLVTYCGECQLDHSPFEWAITPLRYESPVGPLLARFKYRRSLADGRLLAGLLLEALHDHYPERADWPELILPVPLHWQRMLWRGYNQSAELASCLSDELGIPYCNNTLQRVRKTPRQQSLGRAERQVNLKDAFRITGQVAGRRIALVDDVVTTGATTAEIGRRLKREGACEIHLWAIARTPATAPG